MSPRIDILIGGHLSTAPRPQKEAAALVEAGFSVTVHGVWSDDTMVAWDELILADARYGFHPVVDLRARTLGVRAGRLLERARGRAARARFRRAGHFSPSLLGYGAPQLLARARHSSADLTIVHSEGGMWIANELQREGRCVGIDFEDWFSEDLLPEDRAARPVNELRRLEQELSRRCVYVTAASAAMSDGLARAYDAPPPTVIYNVFPAATPDSAVADRGRPDRRVREIPSLHWFSQTIGPGRGLESVLRALPLLPVPVELHLRGAITESRRSWIRALVPEGMDERVHLHPTVAPAELPTRIAEHDIGLALEVPYCRNKDLTISNKLFQYLEGGLAVVATATVGQREILERFPGVGRLVPPDDPAALAHALHRLLIDEGALAAARREARRVAETITWAAQGERVVRLAERAIAGPAVRPSGRGAA